MPQWTPSDLARHVAAAQRIGLVPFFAASAVRHGVPLGVLVALASRESQCGAYIEHRGWVGDGGHGRGIMQIDDRAHPVFTSTHRNDDHAANIDYGAAYLAAQARRFGGYGVAALAAYNAGPAAVQRTLDAGRDPDSTTTGRDFGRDVLSRADALAALLAPFAVATGVVLWALVAGTVAFFAVRHVTRS